MCLSDCSKCKYLDRNPHHRGDILCGLNPAYAAGWKRLESLDEYSKSCLPIDDCREFELDPSFEKKAMQRGLGGFPDPKSRRGQRLHQEAIALSLNFFDWQKLERETSNPTIGNALRDTIIGVNLSLNREEWQEIANSTAIPAVRIALASEGIEAQRDPWICVDSSCIDAIAYLSAESILKIRFNSSLVYQYFRVEESTFLDFCDAQSKGRFFNQHIKDCYNYRCC